jgi:hypothetical protein
MGSSTTWAFLFLAATVGFAGLCLVCRFRLVLEFVHATLHTHGGKRAAYWAWRVACLLTSLVPTSIALLLLGILVWSTVQDDNLPQGGAGLILAVAIGVVGNHVDRQMSTGWTSYWDKVHDSLQAAFPVAPITQAGYPRCQRTRFNVTHQLIANKHGREAAVANILSEPTCTSRRPCRGHGGC